MLQSTSSQAPARAGHATRPREVLGALPQPLLVLQPNCRLVFSNASAEPLLTSGVKSGRLAGLGQLNAAQLSELLARACAGSSSRTGLWFTPSLATGWLHAASLAPAIADASGWPEDSVLVTVHLDQPALTQAARIDVLTLKCRLSRAERQVLLLLADGEPVESVARHLSLRVCTVRSHVRNLLGKTRAPSLMQMLRWTGSAQALPH
ncbi:response regulator transcription factor [Roseateles sp. NT4]|uniref:response regulator transcription factor n=1 Tax=Roseateles sp. NT4 TaxID=3453715 RepID=UPI003EE8F6CC